MMIGRADYYRKRVQTPTKSYTVAEQRLATVSSLAGMAGSRGATGTTLRKPNSWAWAGRRRLRFISYRSAHVKAIEIHHLAPGRHEILDELLLRIIAGVNFSDGPKL